MYTVVRYGNSPLKSGSLWEHPQILQILRFCHRSDLVLSLTISSVCTQFKVNRFTLHGYQDLQDTPCLYKIQAYQKKA